VAQSGRHRKTVEELNAIAASKQMVAPGKWKEFGLKGGVVPEEPKGECADMIAMLLEMERRVAKQSPFYVAKYIMGRSQRQDGKLWGWNWRHVKLSQQDAHRKALGHRSLRGMVPRQPQVHPPASHPVPNRPERSQYDHVA
jgi:hypothetical protein